MKPSCASVRPRVDTRYEPVATASTQSSASARCQISMPPSWHRKSNPRGVPRLAAMNARDGTRFGEATEAYAEGRPGYPAAAVAWMLGDQPLTVLDLGTGTGKLTVQVVAQGHHAVAVDPDASMLAGLNEALPDIDARVGTAEEIPLPDASVDAVVCGQVWHWVDVPAASREVARVLRPGGVLGLVWNLSLIHISEPTRLRRI